ncbi:MAG: GNAT family protein [Verrucomicrobiota bacterium]|jgi:RimJ/RimL family protein N-acetyltransferase
MITEESFIDFRCPYCGETISFPRENAGHPQACPGCTESVIVPEDGSPEGRKLPLPITTERLVLRRFAPADWQDLLECLSDEETFRHMEGRPLEEDDVLRWLERESQVKLTTPDQAFYLGIQSQASEKVVGYVSLSFSEPFQAALQVVLNRAFQRQGLALEAVGAVLGFCFQAIRLHRVTASCHGQNGPACKLCESAGLRREGEFVKSRLFDGEWVNTVSYAALEEEYLQAGR